ncbi:VTT domain-containing protein [Intestinimonas butyriciproducens]|nr:VTT domain-containing protein [Intestinimonas butyriciproducens]MCI6364383.1 VTT domain-containing protein [Intestinimonas butyriciproducens]MDY3616004.1 VTT domain-containing protein [Intestinimonas butyriciproducens]
MWPAFLLTWAAVALGSLVVFCLARTLGQKFVERFVSEKVSERYLGLMKRKRDVFLCLVFLFPFFPDDIICILVP